MRPMEYWEELLGWSGANEKTLSSTLGWMPAILIAKAPPLAGQYTIQGPAQFRILIRWP